MAHHDIEAEFNALRGDVERLRTDFAALGKGILDGAGNAATEISSEQAARFHALLNALTAMLNESMRAARSEAREVGARVGQQPLASLGIAFGIGVLLGRLLDR